MNGSSVSPDLHEKHASAGKDRRRVWLATTILLNILCYILFGLTVCGCHFHLEAFLVGVTPVLWGLFTLLAYRTPSEEAVSWGATVCTFLWIPFSFFGNTIFLFNA